MVWIDYRKAYHIIPNSWILQSLELLQVSENIAEFIRKSMKNYNTDLTSCGEYLSNILISEEPHFRQTTVIITICACMIPVTQILRKVKSGYTLKNREKLNNLLFMDGLKIFVKSECEVNGLVSTVIMILGWNLEYKSVVYLY